MKLLITNYFELRLWIFRELKMIRIAWALIQILWVPVASGRWFACPLLSTSDTAQNRFYRHLCHNCHLWACYGSVDARYRDSKSKQILGWISARTHARECLSIGIVHPCLSCPECSRRHRDGGRKLKDWVGTWFFLFSEVASAPIPHWIMGLGLRWRLDSTKYGAALPKTFSTSWNGQDQVGSTDDIRQPAS